MSTKLPPSCSAGHNSYNPTWYGDLRFKTQMVIILEAVGVDYLRITKGILPEELAMSLRCLLPGYLPDFGSVQWA